MAMIVNMGFVCEVLLDKKLDNCKEKEKMIITELKKMKKMVDWRRLADAALCTAILICGIIFILNLPIYAFFALEITAIVCALIFLFYTEL